MLCPYCGSRSVAKQKVPAGAICKILLTGLAMVLAGWPFKLKLIVILGIGTIMLGIIVFLVTVVPALLRRKSAVWECSNCDKAFVTRVN